MLLLLHGHIPILNKINDQAQMGKTNVHWTNPLLQSITVMVSILGLLGCDSGEIEGVDVVEYEGDPITAEMNAGWTVSADEGTVVLSIVFPDTNKIAQELILIDTGSDLPAFGGYSYYLRGEDSPHVLQSGKIAIQNFDTRGEISGKISGDLWKGPSRLGLKVNSYFRVELSASPP